MPWQKLYENQTIEDNYPQMLAAQRKRADALGLNDPKILHAFAYEDVIVDSLKNHLLVAYQMGLGKTAYTISLMRMWGTQRNLIVAPNKLIAEWEAEFKRLGISDFKVIERYSDIYTFECPTCKEPVFNYRMVMDADGNAYGVERQCRTCGTNAVRKNNLTTFNIVSQRQLWTVPVDSPYKGSKHDGKRAAVTNAQGKVIKGERLGLRHTFSDLLKKACSVVAVDEAYSLKNPDSNQTRAVTNLRARRRLLITGTPVRGYPQNILPLLNWAFGTGSDLFPDYNSREEGSMRNFIAKFAMFQEDQVNAYQTTKRQIPRIRNADEFQAMLAPKMRRRVNTEPAVRAHIKMPEFSITPLQKVMDPDHALFYERWTKEFIDQYQELLRERGKTGRKVGQMEILAKLQMLQQAATCPQGLDPDYDVTTSKQQAVLDLVQDAIERGRKVIVFSMFNSSLQWYRDHPTIKALNPILIDGSVSLKRGSDGKSLRHKMLETFKTSENHNVLLAGVKVLAEGLNIPQASVVVFDSYDWVPSIMQQAYSRVLRPQQKEQVEIYMLSAEGTVDDYMAIWNELKRSSIAEGIDFEENDFELEELPKLTEYINAVVSGDNFTKVYERSEYLRRMRDQIAPAAGQNTP